VRKYFIEKINQVSKGKNMFPYLSLSPTVSIPLSKQHGRGSNPRFTLGGEFKILLTYESSTSNSAAVSNRDFMFKKSQYWGRKLH